MKDNMNKFEYCVFIGRFQPFHIGHLDLLKKALEISETVIVVIGSSHQSPTVKNPWNAESRKKMILGSITNNDSDRIKFIFQEDYAYNDNIWLEKTKQAISKSTNNSDNVALIGCNYDESSFYLELFPSFTFIPTDNSSRFLRATQIRELYFENKTVEMHLPWFVNDYIHSHADEISSVIDDYEYFKKYKKSWENAPFPPVFVTSDVIVHVKTSVQDKGKILLIRRKNAPGKNLLALPGGFIETNERIVNGAVRELIEETSIDLDKKYLLETIKPLNVFDHPTRSHRGRVITHLFYVHLSDFPNVNAADDAESAEWVNIADLPSMKDQFFEDHYHIIEHTYNYSLGEQILKSPLTQP